MAERLTRKALYDLVWSEPMLTFSARFHISNVALEKTCGRAGIPTPERRYWVKKMPEDVFQAAFQQAGEIRMYVEAIGQTLSRDEPN